MNMLQENEKEHNTFINIIINNNNNNNILLNTNNRDLVTFPSRNAYQKINEKESDTIPPGFLLDFTKKFDNQIYDHDSESKPKLSYPDVPPNSFNFDEFDVVGFLNSLKKINNPSIHNEEENQGEIYLPEFQNFNRENQNFLEEDIYTQNKLKQLKNENEEFFINHQEIQNQHIFNKKENFSHLKKNSFNTIPEIKTNAVLQIRKIKFYWRGTQTNLPYIFKKMIIEQNEDENIFEVFEQHDYSKKKIKTNEEEEEI